MMRIASTAMLCTRESQFICPSSQGVGDASCFRLRSRGRPGGYSGTSGMTNTPRQFDGIVLGAGAAGLMCAAVAGQRGRRVAVLEHNAQPGRKILISGGGRCNFTNLHCAPDRFLSNNPHFAKSALAQYEPRHFLELVERYGIAWPEKTLGQLFCDGSARAIVAMLLAECAQGGVDVRVGHTVTDISRPDGGFRLETGQGCFTAAALVLATGGLSSPKMGATGFAHDLARRLGF